jgi:methyl-accepting chemotaxis protein
LSPSEQSGARSRRGARDGRLRARSIGGALSVVVATTLGAALLLSSLGFIAYDVWLFRREAERHTRVMADLVGANSLTALAFDDPEFAGEILSTIGTDAQVLAACLYAQAGEAYARFARDGSSLAACPERGAPGARFEGDRLHLHRPILVDGARVASIYAEVDTSPLWQRIANLVEIVTLVALGASFVAFLVSWRLRRAITGPITALVEQARSVAAGDLSRPMVEAREGELGVLTRAFGAMAEQLRQLIGRVRSNTADVGTAVDGLRETTARIERDALESDAAVGRTSAVLEQLGASIRRVNENVESLSVDAESTTNASTELGSSVNAVMGRLDVLFTAVDTTATSTAETTANIRSIVKSLESLETTTVRTLTTLDGFRDAGASVRESAAENRKLSEHTAETARTGLAAVSETISGIEEIHQSFEEIERTVEHLSEQIRSINEIVSVIDAVAGESSLLALNAQIIAAQAGEHGKSFSVVAQQVKSLSGQTAASAGEITGLIERVKEAAQAVTISVARGSEKVHAGLDQSGRTGSELEAICENAERLQHMGSDIDGAVHRQESGVDEVRRSMAEISGIITTIGRAIGEQETSSGEIARATEKMRELGDAVRRATEEQQAASRHIASAVEGVRSKVEGILRATREQSAESAEIDAALDIFRRSSEASSRRAEDLLAVVADLSMRSQELAAAIDRFRV